MCARKYRHREAPRPQSPSENRELVHGCQVRYRVYLYETIHHHGLPLQNGTSVHKKIQSRPAKYPNKLLDKMFR